MTHPLVGIPVDLTDHDYMARISRSADLFEQAQKARETAVLLDEIGCVGSAADCRVLAHDLDKRAVAELGAKGDQS